MIFYKNKDLKIGLKIEIDNQLYLILENEFVNPGRGHAFNRLKLKNILNKTILKKTIKLGEKLKSADFIEKKFTYLYMDDIFLYFFDKSNMEYCDVEIKIIGENIIWMKEGLDYIIVFWNDDVISVIPPRFIEFQVVNISTDLLNKNYNLAKLDNNGVIKVPLFIKTDDIIKVDTEKNEYISRL
jgi:elongation factor P